MEYPKLENGRTKRKDLDQEVWDDFLNRGEKAFAGLYEAFFDRLYIYGCNIVHDETFVKDAIQEIFLKLLQRDRSELDIQNISSYLFVALRNYLRKELYAQESKRRHQERYLETQFLTEDPVSPLAENTAQNFTELLKKEVNNLPGRQREILFLRFFEGLDYKEISQITAVNHQVVRNYAYRGMKKIRQSLEGVYVHFQSWIIIVLLLLSGAA